MPQGNHGRGNKWGISPEMLRSQKANLNKAPAPQPPQRTHNPFNQTYIDAKTALKPTTPLLKQLNVVNDPNSSFIQQLSQAKTNLKPPRQEQRYIVSPHNNVQNLFNNTYGMSKQAINSRDQQNRPHNMIRPVFKDDNQRKAFRDYAVWNYFLNSNTSEDKRIYKQLMDWSAKGTAMMNFENVDTSRSHPIVYTQGHGSPGVKSISSDDPNEAPVSGSQMAQQLIAMKLPKSSQVRANSCFSGTENWVENTPTTIKNHQNQVVDLESAGDWDNTFAGDMQNNLDLRDGSHNRVRGYMGPTSQGPTQTQSLGVGNILSKNKSTTMRTQYADQSQYNQNITLDLKRSDTKRYGKFQQFKE